jgi:hypothetical protein
MHYYKAKAEGKRVLTVQYIDMTTLAATILFNNDHKIWSNAYNEAYGALQNSIYSGEYPEDTDFSLMRDELAMSFMGVEPKLSDYEMHICVSEIKPSDFSFNGGESDLKELLLNAEKINPAFAIEDESEAEKHDREDGWFGSMSNRRFWRLSDAAYLAGKIISDVRPLTEEEEEVIFYFNGELKG